MNGMTTSDAGAMRLLDERLVEKQKELSVFYTCLCCWIFGFGKAGGWGFVGKYTGYL